MAWKIELRIAEYSTCLVEYSAIHFNLVGASIFQLQITRLIYNMLNRMLGLLIARYGYCINSIKKEILARTKKELTAVKEIKAYIRCEKAEEVVHALEDAGVSGVTLIDVMAVGPNIDPKNYKYSIECVEKYQKVAKLEIICTDEEADQFVKVLRESAYTGMHGDGIISVSEIERLVKIRTGTEGPEALAQ
ncbi:MAG: P-II family nitrogen regulator [Calditrichaeota bacterium]|nr:MAG: P-II family nitrogen regulator [Calditrichota bacterium]